MKKNKQNRWQSRKLTPYLFSAALVFLVNFNAAQAVLDPVNIARNRPVTASVGLARYAVDGIITTRWISGPGDPQWIRVDLGANYNINRVRLVWEGAFGRDYQVQVSADDVSWTTIRTVTGNTVLTNDLTGLDDVARFVRILCTARGTPWDYSIFEFEVYGTLVSTTESLLSIGRPAIASNEALPARNAVDGRLDTRWGTAAADPQWIRVDLGEIVYISRAIIRWEGAFGRDYRVEVSDDDVNWTTVRTVTGNTVLINELLNIHTTGRFVRIFGTARGTMWGYSMWELEIFGSAIADCAVHAISVSPSTPRVCGGSSVTLNASGANSYEWLGGLGVGPQITVTPASTTTYTVVGTTGLCRDTTTVTVTVVNEVNVSVDPPSVSVCAGSSVILTASGADSYEWLAGVGVGAEMSVTPAITTTFTVVGTIGLCRDTTTVLVTVNPVPEVLIAAPVTEICAGGSVALTASGADSFEWLNGLGSDAGITVTPSTTTTYTVVGTTGNCLDTLSVTIIVNRVSDLSTSISGETITANLQDAIYQWLDCNNNFAVIAGETNRSFTATESGSYAVMITHTGCVDTTACANVVVVRRIVFDTYGIFTERATVTERFVFGDGNGNLFIWANLSAIVAANPFEGAEVLAFSSPGSGWYGLGINSANPIDLTHFANGYLNFAIRVLDGSAESFRVGMHGVTPTEGLVTFAPGNDPAGFVRDGNWHRLSIPMTTLTAQGLNLTASNNLFVLVSGEPTSGIFVDDVYLSLTPPVVVNVPSLSADVVKVYPNPVLDRFVVSFKANTQRIEILNITGKIVHQEDISAGSTMVKIDCSEWSSGIYIVRTIGIKGEYSSAKITVK